MRRTRDSCRRPHESVTPRLPSTGRLPPKDCLRNHSDDRFAKRNRTLRASYVHDSGPPRPCLYRMSARPLRARVPTPTPMPWEGVFQPVARAADRTHAHLPISLAAGADHAPTAAACSPAASYLTASTHAPPAKCSRHGSLGGLVAHGVPGWPRGLCRRLRALAGLSARTSRSVPDQKRALLFAA
jgi:hypothetical protein